MIPVLVLALAAASVYGQSLTNSQGEAVLNFGGGDGSEEEHFEKEILVIPNRFPKELNFFCYPRSDLMRDRLCFGQLDAFALACADDTPPLHLVPFCIAFRGQCSKLNYPSDDMCQKEKKRYKGFCTHTKKQRCKSCHYDLSCSCEPYECIWRRYGYETARWCQQYELFCNHKKRREKANELIPLMRDAVKVHYRCMHMFNLPQVICDPFRKQFDPERCTKFLFDCELISEWDDEEEVTTEDKILVEEKAKQPPSKEMGPPNKAGSSKVPLTPEEQLVAKKIADEEKLLEQLLKESEKDEKSMKTGNRTIVIDKIADEEKLLEQLLKEDEKSMKTGNATIVKEIFPMGNKTMAAVDDHPFSKVQLKERPKSPF